MSCRIITLNHLLTLPAGKWKDCSAISQQIKASYASTDASLQALIRAKCVERERLNMAMPDGSKRRVWHYRVIAEIPVEEIRRRAGIVRDKPKYQPMVTVSAALDALFAALDRGLRGSYGT